MNHFAKMCRDLKPSNKKGLSDEPPGKVRKIGGVRVAQVTAEEKAPEIQVSCFEPDTRRHLGSIQAIPDSGADKSVGGVKM